MLKNTILLFSTLCVYSLLSCSNQKRKEQNYFHYNEATGISSLDPAFAKNQSNIWAVHQLFNTLVETDEQLHIVPSLAKQWEISNDRLIITFHLRTDVYFHNDACFANGKGRKLVSADVVYSFQRLMDGQTASPGAWVFHERVEARFGFQAIDDSTFQLTLKKPFVQILGVLSNVYCSVIPKEAIEKYGSDFRRHPVGSGPFQFKTWEEGQVLVLHKNEQYFERDETNQPLPYIDGIKVSFLDSKAAEFLEFRQKRLDFINDIDASFKDELLTRTGNLRKEWEGKIVLNKHSYLNIEYFGILADTNNSLVKTSPLKMKAVRQAINYGFDKRKLILYLRNSIGTSAESGFVPMGLPSFDSNIVKGYSYNPTKAKALLREAGFDAAHPPPVLQLLTIPIYADLAGFIAKEQENIGLTVKVEAIPKSLLLTQTAKNQALFFRASWIADYPDAENYFSVFYSKNPSPPNYTRYNNPAFDHLYEQSTREPDDSLRFRMYRQMDQMIMDDAPVIPVWYDMVIHLVQPTVKNFKPNSLNWLELRKVKLQ